MEPLRAAPPAGRSGAASGAGEAGEQVCPSLCSPRARPAAGTARPAARPAAEPSAGPRPGGAAAPRSPGREPSRRAGPAVPGRGVGRPGARAPCAAGGAEKPPRAGRRGECGRAAGRPRRTLGVWRRSARGSLPARRRAEGSQGLFGCLTGRQSYSSPLPGSGAPVSSVPSFRCCAGALSDCVPSDERDSADVRWNLCCTRLPMLGAPARMACWPLERIPASPPPRLFLRSNCTIVQYILYHCIVKVLILVVFVLICLTQFDVQES